MMISGLGNSSADLLSSVLKSGTSGSSTSAGNESAGSSDEMTVSQIRDKVDQMATSGQLTTQQQMALIASGFQDLNANDPSYQPASQDEGYTRSSTQTFDLSSTLQSISTFDTAQGNPGMAATYSNLANLFKQDEAISSLKVTS
jgi:hypothetical protein